MVFGSGLRVLEIFSLEEIGESLELNSNSNSLSSYPLVAIENPIT